MAGLKKIALNIYNFGLLSPERKNHYQKKIRDTEWEAIKEFIPESAHFLDIGCGTGYSMKKASKDKKCTCKGIDPFPGQAGAHTEVLDMDIRKGEAEAIPFSDSSFDIVFSSHVLEHVRDTEKSLSEMLRVCTPTGQIIIGVPTHYMAWVNAFQNLLFTTHQRLLNYLFPKLMKVSRPRIRHIFAAPSHHQPQKTAFTDMKDFSISRWRKLIGRQMKIVEEIRPALYPYPDYRQVFPMYKSKRLSSSVFFICSRNEK